MTDYQRAENMRIILDHAREQNDSRLKYGDKGENPLDFMSWLRGMKTVTLDEAVKIHLSPEPKHTQLAGSATWGTGVDFLISASIAGLDDSTTALGLFASTVIGPMPNGPKSLAKGRAGKYSFIFWESMEYVSGLYDTLRYHPDSMPLSIYAPLMDGNIYEAAAEARDGLSALLKVTDCILQADLDKQYCLRDDQYENEEPFRYYSGYHAEGSIWLRNGELVKYVLDNRDACSFIADIVTQRQTDDPEIIAGIMEQGVTSLASGVL